MCGRKTVIDLKNKQILKQRIKHNDASVLAPHPALSLITLHVPPVWVRVCERLLFMSWGHKPVHGHLGSAFPGN